MLAVGLVGHVGSATAQSVDGALRCTDSSHVELGDPGNVFDLVPGGERAFMLWLRYEQPQYHAKILQKVENYGAVPDGGGRGFAFFVHQYVGTLGVWVYGEKGGYSVRGTAGLHPIGDGEWHHVAVVQEDTMLTAYVDGELDWTYNIRSFLSELPNESTLQLAWNGSDVIHFVGAMDEMSVWNRALTGDEVNELMYERLQGNEAGLTAYYPFDRLDGQRVLDRGPHGYHGRATGLVATRAARPTRPPWTHTWWFYTLCVLVGLAPVYGLMRLYAWRIERQRQQLERVVDERTREVEQQKEQLAEQAEQLQELNSLKSRFLANISHEFRTPLTLSMGPLTDLKDRLEDKVGPDAHCQIDQALLNNRRLLRLVNQLLDVSRLEASSLGLSVRPVHLQQYLRSIARAFEGLAERKSITFRRSFPDSPVTIYADPDQLEKVVTNLLSNAFKYTPAGETVELRLKRTDCDAAITVRDTGVGIPAEELPHIFDRFYRSGSGTRAQQVGTGIGLALAKELTELHGGHLDVTSDEGEGAAFTVRLPTGTDHFADESDVEISEDPLKIAPLADVESHAERAVAERDPVPDAGDQDDVDRPTVLFVDDNVEMRTFVREHLTSHYRVLDADDGVDALATARETTPDVIVSDVMMPRMDGFALVRKLRQDPELDFVPVILLTARVEQQDKLEGLSTGADDYLTKPFDVEELLARIRGVIRLRQRLKREIQQRQTVRRAGADSDDADPDADPFRARLRDAVEANLSDETFGVEALAEALGLSRATLYRRMPDDETPADFLRTARLKRAAHLLETEAGNVSEVAYAVGFRSVPHFIKRFRSHFGDTPAVYAAEHEAE